MPRKIPVNNSPHFKFNKETVCNAFSEVYSRQYGCEIVFRLVEKEPQPAEKEPQNQT